MPLVIYIFHWENRRESIPEQPKGANGRGAEKSKCVCVRTGLPELKD